MKHVSIIKDIFGNTPHAILIKEDNSLHVEGITEFGKSIASDMSRFGTMDTKQIPDGFMLTPFREVTPQMEDMLNSSFGDVYEKTIKQIGSTTTIQQSPMLHMGRSLMNTQKSIPSSSIPMTVFKNHEDKSNIVNYKAKKFNLASKTSTAMASIDGVNIGFNKKDNVFTLRKNDAFSQYLVEKLILSVGKSSIRRFLNSGEKLDEKSASRRVERRVKSIVEIETKEDIDMSEKIKMSIQSRFQKHEKR